VLSWPPEIFLKTSLRRDEIPDFACAVRAGGHLVHVTLVLGLSVGLLVWTTIEAAGQILSIPWLRK
jgi:hypothetical protein